MPLQSIDLASGGSASFPFEQIGDSVTGKIINLEELQQTDLQTGELKTFDNGQPMMMYRVELQTQLSSGPLDDGVRSVYLKGSKKPESGSSLAAVLAAVLQATGRAALSVGGTLALTYVGDGQARTRGFSAPKLYSASYSPPSVTLDAAPAAPAVPAAPVAAPAAPAVPAAPVAAPAAPAVPAAPGLTPEQLAALAAAGIDPATIPGYTPPAA